MEYIDLVPRHVKNRYIKVKKEIWLLKLIRQFTKEDIQLFNKHMGGEKLISFTIREMQIKNGNEIWPQVFESGLHEKVRNNMY